MRIRKLIVYKCDMCGAEHDYKDEIRSIKRKIRGMMITFDVCNRCILTVDDYIKAMEKKEGKK